MAAISRAILREITEVEARKTEGNQQFKYEWTKYSKMQWQSMYQPKDMLLMVIEEMWKLMMKPSRWRKLKAERMINQNLELIEK